MPPVVDFAFIEIDRRGCKAVAAIDVTDESSGLEAVPALSPDRKAIGFKEGVDMYSFTITHKRLIPLEVDYRALRADRTEFDVVYQERAGNRLGSTYQLLTCRVQNVAKGFTAEGETADVVQCIALDHVEE
jgi:hypothetical protein